MANYVVDASVIIEYIVTGTFTPLAADFFNQIADTDLLIVPEFCLLECTNVLWKQVRFNGLSQAEALETLRDLRSLKLQRTPMKKLLERTLEISIHNHLAVYDSAYIALALHYKCPLVTLDQPQLRGAVAVGAIYKPLTDFSPSTN